MFQSYYRLSIRMTSVPGFMGKRFCVDVPHPPGQGWWPGAVAIHLQFTVHHQHTIIITPNKPTATVPLCPSTTTRSADDEDDSRTRRHHALTVQKLGTKCLLLRPLQKTPERTRTGSAHAPARLTLAATPCPSPTVRAYLSRTTHLHPLDWGCDPVPRIRLEGPAEIFCEPAKESGLSSDLRVLLLDCGRIME